MAERIAEAIDGDERLLVEAGTGTGKTLAYLVPALLSGRKVVVSTGTKTLQDQNRHRRPAPPARDVRPRRAAARAARVGGDEGAVELRLPAAAGRTRPAAIADRGARAGPAARVRRVVADRRSRRPARSRRRRAAVGRRRGDARDAHRPALRILRELLRDRDAPPRRRRAADHRQPPPVLRGPGAARALARGAGAAAVRGRDLRRGPPDRGRRDRVLRRARVDPAAVRAGAHLGRETGVDAQRAQAAAGRLKAATDALADALRDLVPAPRPGVEEARVAFPGGLRPAARSSATTISTDASNRSPTGCTPTATRSPPRARPIELAGLARRASALRADLSLLVAGRGREHVRWLAASPRNVGLHASPVDVSPVLGRALDGCPGPIVLTSATLTVAGSFDYLRARVGLGDTASDATFASPFRYNHQALLYLAPDLPIRTTKASRSQAAARMADLCAVTARARAAALHQLPQHAHRGGLPARGPAVPVAGPGRTPASPAAGVDARAGSARCCWRRRASGRASTSPARRCRWSSWIGFRSRSPTIR